MTRDIHIEDKSKILKIIYKEYFKKLVVCSLMYTHRADIAEDIVEDVIINFIEKNRIATLQGSLMGYLRVAVIKASIKYNRDNNKLLFEDLETDAAEEAYSIIDEENLDESIEFLLSAIENLPQRSRQILYLIVFEDKKHQQVANELSISINSVKSQYYSSLTKLRNSITKTYFIFF